MSKAKKLLRPCPALGRDITPAECGEGRGSRYRCPADCPFFPFTPANYEKHGEIEDRLIQKAIGRAARELPEGEREALVRDLDAADWTEDAILTNHSRFAWLFHVRRDTQGLTMGERWLADRFNGLTNDERVLLTGMNRMHPALFEIHRIVDEQTIAGVDLLTGQTLNLIDQRATAMALRFAVLLSWVYPMEHYDRMSGGALYVSEVPPFAPEETLREVVRHLGGPSDAAGEQVWLGEHFGRVCTALNAVKSARWHDAMASADMRYIKTDYRLRKSAPLLARLARHGEVEEEPPTEQDGAQGFRRAFVWLSAPRTPDANQLDLPLPGPPKLGAAPLVLGRVLVSGERARVEAMTGARHQELRGRFEKVAAGHLEFIGERADDLGAQTSGAQTRKFDPALVPPRLREKPEQIIMATQRIALPESGGKVDMAALFREQYVDFADAPLPGLDGQSPRAAAANPALRPRVVALMKRHIRDADRRRRHEGLDLDLNPLLADLGLHELISEPPPLETEGDPFAEDELAEQEDDSVFDKLAALGRGLGPHGGRPPLTEQDVDRQLAATQARYPEAEDALRIVDETFPGLLDCVSEATEETLLDSEWVFLELLVLQACRILGPSSPPGPDLEFERILRGFAGEFGRISKIMVAGKPDSVEFERWMCDSPQPVVMQSLGATLMGVIEKLRRKQRPSDGAVLLILSFTKAVVAELSRAGE